ncbi:MAG TPA: glyoxalase [Aliiroseovarius sp.]|nr:glyoxalase [Aliiroseovarius sp.]
MNNAIALDHVQLAMPEGGEAAARAFWGGVVGLAEIEKPAPLRARGGCWFRLGGAELHLGVETPFSPAKKAHPGFRVTGIDALADRLKMANHPIAWDDAIANRKRFFTQDPFGNRLEFLEDQT